jgi:hypothetical protein
MPYECYYRSLLSDLEVSDSCARSSTSERLISGQLLPLLLVKVITSVLCPTVTWYKHTWPLTDFARPAYLFIFLTSSNWDRKLFRKVLRYLPINTLSYTRSLALKKCYRGLLRNFVSIYQASTPCIRVIVWIVYKIGSLTSANVISGLFAVIL